MSILDRQLKYHAEFKKITFQQAIDFMKDHSGPPIAVFRTSVHGKKWKVSEISRSVVKVDSQDENLLSLLVLKEMGFQ